MDRYWTVGAPPLDYAIAPDCEAARAHLRERHAAGQRVSAASLKSYLDVSEDRARRALERLEREGSVVRLPDFSHPVYRVTIPSD